MGFIRRVTIARFLCVKCLDFICVFMNRLLNLIRTFDYFRNVWMDHIRKLDYIRIIFKLDSIRTFDYIRTVFKGQVDGLCPEV